MKEGASGDASNGRRMALRRVREITCAFVFENSHGGMGNGHGRGRHRHGHAVGRGGGEQRPV